MGSKIRGGLARVFIGCVPAGAPGGLQGALPGEPMFGSTRRVMLKDALAPLVDLVYPPRCPLCGGPVGTQGGLCPDCWSDLVVPSGPACDRCDGPLKETAEVGRTTCSLCINQPPSHEGITAATLYTHAARRLVVSFKHGRKMALARMFARLISARLPELEGEWIVIPVPLHRWRLWQRGFNQSAFLARELARERGLGLVVDGLVRVRNTRSLSQSRLGRAERAQMLRGAIAANPRRAAVLADAQVLLVDDVLTSGATTDACLAALHDAGVRRVRIACFSRVQGEAM